MKSVLLAAAAVALAAMPAMAQDAPPAPPAPPPPSYDSSSQSNYLSFMDSPYRSADVYTHPGQCFNGRNITGANRVGDRTLYVQSKRSPIYRLELKDSCDALYAAQKLKVRSAGYAVCAGEKATIVVKTPAGEQRCKVSEVKRLTRTEVADIAASARR